MFSNGYIGSTKFKLGVLLLCPLVISIVISMAGCGRAEPESAAGISAAERPVIFVSIPPQKTFVREIAGERPIIHVMVRPGHSPATYEPTPRQMAALSSAHLYFSIGVPFEEVWMERLRRNNPRMMVVSTTEQIELLTIDGHHHHHEHHDEPPNKPIDSKPVHRGEGGHCVQGRKDPHVWLDPQLVKKQAETMAAALQEIDPSYAHEYKLNLADFKQKLDDLDADIKQLLEGLKEGHTFMVFHPSWGYFATAYGLRQVAVEVEGKDPGGKALTAIIEQAKADDVNIIFVQPQFSRKSAETVAKAINAKVEVLDPLSENYFDNLRRAAAKLAEEDRL